MCHILGVRNMVGKIQWLFFSSMLVCDKTSWGCCCAGTVRLVTQLTRGGGRLIGQSVQCLLVCGECQPIWTVMRWASRRVENMNLIKIEKSYFFHWTLCAKKRVFNFNLSRVIWWSFHSFRRTHSPPLLLRWTGKITQNKNFLLCWAMRMKFVMVTCSVLAFNNI